MANRKSDFLQGPQTEEEIRQYLHKSLLSGEHVKVRILNYTKAGDPFYNTLEVFPLHDTSKRLTHYCGVLSGETVADGKIPKFERAPLPPLASVPVPPADDESEGRRPKRMKRNMRTADALANSVDAVVMTQAEPPYAITHVNQPWCEMCGYTLEEVEGLTNSILQGPETDVALVNDLMASVRRGEPASATLVNYKKGGKRFVNQVEVLPVYNEEDELEQFMAMLQEVDAPADALAA